MIWPHLLKYLCFLTITKYCTVHTFRISGTEGIPVQEKKNWGIECQFPNNIYIIKDKIAKVLKKDEVNDGFYQCELFQNITDMFVTPIPSRYIGVFELSDLEHTLENIQEKHLNHKDFLISLDSKTFVCELLHNVHN